MSFIVFLFLTVTVYGCSDFQVKAEDGSFIYGRAMDFMMPLSSEVVLF